MKYIHTYMYEQIYAWMHMSMKIKAKYYFIKKVVNNERPQNLNLQALNFLGALCMAE